MKGEQGREEFHVASPYLRSQIKAECEEVEDFIEEGKIKLDKGEINRQTELDDKEILISCSKKISRNPILTLILHEMGHSFGLSHNFKASFDESNYWTSETEMKTYFPNAESFTPELPKSSSVMDYLPPLSAPNLTVLGKYDLAVLKFLYMNQFEYRDQMEAFGWIQAFSKNKRILFVKVPGDPSQQKPFSQHHPHVL